MIKEYYFVVDTILFYFRCPVDSYVFPELDKGRTGDSLEARFNAFKIPESNFLVFEATVRTCREGCQPAYCQSGSGRSEPSFGRRKREINESLALEFNQTTTTTTEAQIIPTNSTSVIFTNTVAESVPANKELSVDNNDESGEEKEAPEFVREMIEVSRYPSTYKNIVFKKTRRRI